MLYPIILMLTSGILYTGFGQDPTIYPTAYPTTSSFPTAYPTSFPTAYPTTFCPLASSTGLEVEILGRSGKISVGYNAGSDDGEDIQITMASVTERDSNGEAVGNSGSVQHSFNNFASQDFEFSDCQDGIWPNSTATYRSLTFTSKLFLDTELRIQLFFFLTGGVITDGSATYNVSTGAIKFSYYINKWPFCTLPENGGTEADNSLCRQGRNYQEGSVVDFEIEIKGADSFGVPTSQQGNGKPSVIAWNNGAEFIATAEYKVGNSYLQMPSGYPLLEAKANKVSTFFRFARFEESDGELFYDPYAAVPEVETTTSMPTPAPTTAPTTSMPTPAPTTAPTTSAPTPAPTAAPTALFDADYFDNLNKTVFWTYRTTSSLSTNGPVALCSDNNRVGRLRLRYGLVRTDDDGVNIAATFRIKRLGESLPGDIFFYFTVTSASGNVYTESTPVFAASSRHLQLLSGLPLTVNAGQLRKQNVEVGVQMKYSDRLFDSFRNEYFTLSAGEVYTVEVGVHERRNGAVFSNYCVEYTAN